MAAVFQQVQVTNEFFDNSFGVRVSECGMDSGIEGMYTIDIDSDKDEQDACAEVDTFFDKNQQIFIELNHTVENSFKDYMSNEFEKMIQRNCIQLDQLERQVSHSFAKRAVIGVSIMPYTNFNEEQNIHKFLSNAITQDRYTLMQQFYFIDSSIQELLVWREHLLKNKPMDEEQYDFQSRIEELYEDNMKLKNALIHSFITEKQTVNRLFHLIRVYNYPDTDDSIAIEVGIEIERIFADMNESYNNTINISCDCENGHYDYEIFH